MSFSYIFIPFVLFLHFICGQGGLTVEYQDLFLETLTSTNTSETNSLSTSFLYFLFFTDSDQQFLTDRDPVY